VVIENGCGKKLRTNGQKLDLKKGYQIKVVVF